MTQQAVTVSDICLRLNVTTMQVLTAIYSGALPKPNDHNEWDSKHIEPFIKNWQDRIARRRKKDHDG